MKLSFLQPSRALFVILIVMLSHPYSAASPVPSSDMSCNEGEFRCEEDAACIPSGRVCDGAEDCLDGTDEGHCADGAPGDAPDGAPGCAEGLFRCDSDGICVDASWVCDGRIDCADKSDELNCQHAIQCSEDEVRCNKTGHCLKHEMICDGANDCIDYTDEENCPEPTTRKTHLSDDAISLRVIPADFVLDDDFSLPDNFRNNEPLAKLIAKIQSENSQINNIVVINDEFSFGENFSIPINSAGSFSNTLSNSSANSVLLGTSLNETKLLIEVLVDKNHMVNITDSLNSTLYQIVEGKFELDASANQTEISAMENFTEAEYNFTSSFNETYLDIEDSNGTFTTLEVETEELFPTQQTTILSTTTTTQTSTTPTTTIPVNPCLNGAFYCQLDETCIPVEWRCDHTDDCWDGSDEIHCDEVECPNEMVKCHDTGRCIFRAWLCDGVSDCDTGTDELYCH